MNGPVLAFRNPNPKKPRQQHTEVQARVQNKVARLIECRPIAMEVVEDLIDYFLSASTKKGGAR